MDSRKLAWLASVGAVAAVLACGSTPTSPFADPDGGVVDPDSGDPFGKNDSGEGGGKAQGCSSDLRSVIDENGVVQLTCPPDQGCAAGKCVPPR